MKKKTAVKRLIQQFNAWDKREINSFSVDLKFLSSDFDLKTYISKRYERGDEHGSEVGRSSSGSEYI